MPQRHLRVCSLKPMSVSRPLATDRGLVVGEFPSTFATPAAAPPSCFHFHFANICVLLFVMPRKISIFGCHHIPPTSNTRMPPVSMSRANLFLIFSLSAAVASTARFSNKHVSKVAHFLLCSFSRIRLSVLAMLDLLFFTILDPLVSLALAPKNAALQ